MRHIIQLPIALLASASPGACNPVLLPQPQEAIDVVVLDASKGSAPSAEARCPVLAREVHQTLATTTSNLRVVALRTGGASGSPVLLADVIYKTASNGFAARVS